jgi:hypothetical protein
MGPIGPVTKNVCDGEGYQYITDVLFLLCLQHEAGSRYSSYACYLFCAAFLLGLFANTEHGGDIFLRNVLTFSGLHAIISRKICLQMWYFSINWKIISFSVMYQLLGIEAINILRMAESESFKYVYNIVLSFR